MGRVRGRDLGRCLVVPVGVGKSTATALVADHFGEIVVGVYRYKEPGWWTLRPDNGLGNNVSDQLGNCGGVTPPQLGNYFGAHKPVSSCETTARAANSVFNAS
jgi:hypothetical protein